MGTDVVVTFNEAAAIFEGSGVVAMGREATFGPFESASLSWGQPASQPQTKAP